MDSRQSLLEAIEAIGASGGYWPARLGAELGYLSELSRLRSGEFDDALADIICPVAASARRSGSLSREAALEAERELAWLGPAAKSLELLCAGHAHIDMNWMWGFEETAWVCLETFRTVLRLMDEYPLFRFSQSQAATYRIVERYEPSMLERIGRRVAEGRWEVTASSWVESDRNLPSGESLARQIVAARRYLGPLLGLGPESLDIDFEPDSFGHAASLPSILAAGGIKYLYHCRGSEGEVAYRWRSPSGASVIAYREPEWYLGPIEAGLAARVPAFCDRYGIRSALKVYGVGDHGGGPTRRDVERVMDMSTWPLYPAIRFGTFGEFFRILESDARLPLVEGELNPVFEGCYSSQSRIKVAHRAAEARLVEAELLSSLVPPRPGEVADRRLLDEAWEELLFCQFHDILPGSGTPETREYAMAKLQDCLAAADLRLGASLRELSSRVDAGAVAESAFPGSAAEAASVEGLSLPEGRPAWDGLSEGAGVGFGATDYGLPRAERGRGRTRAFVVFNPSLRPRSETVELEAWDWPVEDGRIEARDSSGRRLRHQLLPNEKLPFWEKDYWFHGYRRLLVEASVPACGYTTIVLGESGPERPRIPEREDPRLSKASSLVLENEEARAVLDPRGLALVEYIDKASGRSLIAPEGARFRLALEDDSGGMTAWNSRPYVEVRDLHAEGRARLLSSSLDRGSLRQSLLYELRFRSSRVEVELSLNEGSPRLDLRVRCDWREAGAAGGGVPRLELRCPLAYGCSSYRYDIPSGTIDRPAVDQDRPAVGWAMGLPEDGGLGLALLSKGLSGFRGAEGALSLALLRASFDPDPLPEAGERRFRLALLPADPRSRAGAIAAAYDFAHPLLFRPAGPSPAPEGAESSPPELSLLALLEGSIALGSLSAAPGGDGSLVLRVYEAEGGSTLARLRFASPLLEARACGLDGGPLPRGCPTREPRAEGLELLLELGPWELASYRLKLAPADRGRG